MENKRDPEKNPRSLYPLRFALAPAGVPGLGASPGVWAVSSLLVYRSYHEGPYASESVLKYWSYGKLWHIAFGMAAFLSLSSGVALY